VSLPTFLTRIHNAAGPLLGGIGESELGERLAATTVLLEISDAPAADPGHRAGYLLAANLGARLYPRLALDAPADLTEEAAALASAINPRCEFGPPKGDVLTLSWRGGEPGPRRVTLAAEGWNLFCDTGEPAAAGAVPPAAMAAATIGVGELFRALFADLLEHGRTAPSPFALNLVTLSEPTELPPFPQDVELGEVHLAGCGAIGQAAVLTLSAVPVTGTLVAVDHEPLDEGNLQRYLLARAADQGTAKVELVERALAGHPLEVVAVPARWGSDDRSAPGRATVLSALDTKQGRIELQGGLPREIFNAWTQPLDTGVSRHQAFGTEPCLACLGWPKGPRPSRVELIAAALGQHEQRVSRYLLSGLPVGTPLSAEQLKASPRRPLPEDAPRWAEVALLEDLITARGLPRTQFEPLGGLGVDGLYRDAVCAGMLIAEGTEREAEVSVPLAHQSALAGILLASALVVDRVPGLRERRPGETVAKYDVLRGGEQHWARPRKREARCICQDLDYLDAYAERWASGA